MTRILATAIASAVGWIFGFILLLAFSFEAAPIAFAIVLGASGFLMSPKFGEPYGRNDKKVLGQGIDMALISFWGARPALKRIEHRQDRYLRAEKAILDMCIPGEIQAKTHNMDDIMALLRQSMNTGGIPLQALKRHNRAFKPGVFRKKSASYTILGLVATALVEAGADRRGAVWYYDFASKLKVPYKHAVEFLDNAFHEQLRSPSMIPGFPDHDSELGQASQGIAIPQEMEPYLDAFDKQRAQVLEAMFPSDSQAA